MNQLFDIAVIGGGINGCGIAADAALRGLSVYLAEKDDLASKTSSSSSKLIHGGLRYLEYYDFSLVKKALDERQNLLQLAPHIVYPLPFVLPYLQSMRPTWLLKTGLFLYDHLSRKNQLPRSRLIKREKQANYFSPLLDEFHKGFLFYDCATDDARLTIANALQAKENGAVIKTRTKLVQALANEQYWTLKFSTTEGIEEIQAKVLVNATGPWVEQLNQLLDLPSLYHLAMVKGSHLVVQRLYEGNQAYLLQNIDNRIVFVIPYYGHTLIGTTDVNYEGLLDEVSISPAEINYLLQLVKGYFKQTLTRNDIIYSWSGVRPLLSKAGQAAQALSRDYIYHFNAVPAPVLCIYGGKITTYRQLSKEAVDTLKTVFPNLPPSTTVKTPLPGATWHDLSFAEYSQMIAERYRWLNKPFLARLLHTYGTRSEYILNDCHQYADFGMLFGGNLYEKEVDYLVAQEWAQSADDILWRRTKTGFMLNPVEKSHLEEFLQKKIII